MFHKSHSEPLKPKFWNFYQVRHLLIMPPHKADKALIYRGRIALKIPTDIFQAIFNFSISNPSPLKFDYLQRSNRSQQLSSICQKSPEMARIHWSASPYPS